MTPRNATAEPIPTSARGCTNFKLKQLTRRVTRHYERFMDGAGLKITQYSLLSHVVTLGPIGAGELAVRMALGPSTLTRNLQPLVDQGWIEIRPGADARSRIVAATAAGVAQRAQAQKAWKRAQLALNEQLGAQRVAALHALIDDCLAHLEDTDD
jgi:DNA-binding MarR family transcriptional regulator